jgi:hypothetical protein
VQGRKACLLHESCAAALRLNLNMLCKLCGVHYLTLRRAQWWAPGGHSARPCSERRSLGRISSHVFAVSQWVYTLQLAATPWPQQPGALVGRLCNALLHAMYVHGSTLGTRPLGCLHDCSCSSCLGTVLSPCDGTGLVKGTSTWG